MAAVSSQNATHQTASPKPEPKPEWHRSEFIDTYYDHLGAMQSSFVTGSAAIKRLLNDQSPAIRWEATIRERELLTTEVTAVITAAWSHDPRLREYQRREHHRAGVMSRGNAIMHRLTDASKQAINHAGFLGDDYCASPDQARLSRTLGNTERCREDHFQGAEARRSFDTASEMLGVAGYEVTFGFLPGGRGYTRITSVAT